MPSKKEITLKTIQEAKAHNETALALIIGHMMPTIQFYSKRVAQPSFELEDAIQEALIGLFYAIENYNSAEEASFNTYANRCIRNAVISALRKATQKKQLILNEHLELNENEHTIGFEDQLIMNELLDQTMDKVNTQLSKFEQKVLLMYAAGFSYKEIAETLNKTNKSIENAILRARKKLKS